MLSDRRDAKTTQKKMTPIKRNEKCFTIYSNYYPGTKTLNFYVVDGCPGFILLGMKSVCGEVREGCWMVNATQ